MFKQLELSHKAKHVGAGIQAQAYTANVMYFPLLPTVKGDCIGAAADDYGLSWDLVKPILLGGSCDLRAKGSWSFGEALPNSLCKNKLVQMN